MEERIPRERIKEALWDAMRGLGREVEEEVLKLAEHITIDSSATVMQIAGESVPLDKLDSSLNERILLALYRAQLLHKISVNAATVAHVLATAAREIANAVRGLEVVVDVKHVGVREELADALAQELLKRHVIKTFKRGNDVLGVYCFDGVIFKECEADLVREIYDAVRSDEATRKKTVRWVVNEALQKVKGLALTELKEEPMVLAFKNVLFDWRRFLGSGSLRASITPPSPDTIAFHRIPHKLNLEMLERLEGLAKWSENIVENLEELAERLCPQALKAFKDWVGQKWPLLFEIVGYSLYPKYDFHRAIMLVGEGSNGKSTYLRLLKDILGPENITSISLQDLTDDNKRFTVAQLYHKLANIYGDLPSDALRSTGRFKILTGEDSICADRKFRDPLCFVSYAKLIFSTNELPLVRDMSEGFWRRWIVLEFPNKFAPDPGFYDRTFTEEEVEGAIIVSLHAFRNVVLRRAFSFEGTAADYKEYWLRATDSVYAFLSDLLGGALASTLGVSAALDDQSRVDADKLYTLYTRYCELEDREPLGKSAFTQALARHGIKRVFVRGQRYYRGLRLVDGAGALDSTAQPPPD